MCGIFGMILSNTSKPNYNNFEQGVKLLFTLSKQRGQDAAGLALSHNKKIEIFRRVMNPKEFIKEKTFTNILNSSYFDAKGNEKTQDSPLIIIGQCRLATNGSFAINDNNQPVREGILIGVHNGIVTNAQGLNIDNDKFSQAQKIYFPTSESVFALSDTRLFFTKINAVYEDSHDLTFAVSSVFKNVEGSASIALFSSSEARLVIATNTGSLYYLIEPFSGNAVFASERETLNVFLKRNRIFPKLLESRIQQVAAGSAVEFIGARADSFTFAQKKNFKKESFSFGKFNVQEARSSVEHLKRCSCCILPETYPFISFDEKGVCNFCRLYEKQKFYGTARLERFLEKYRSSAGSPDCLVGLSGGRDSCYGLHLLKNQFGMHPIAYTYDWGLTTDTSRRNQARLCGKLGIEQIIRAPDIQKKRANVRANIYAWLKNPQLGMVPLFMAGDKDFYHYGRQLRKELGVKLTVFCSGYLLEQREFFVGFCGINENVSATARLYKYNFMAKLKLAMYYLSQYIKNPAYINESFIDSIRSYFTSFIGKDDFLYLYEYLPWEQEKIEEVIKREYGWESDRAYGQNQWRMGDGQTAFTNYIYYAIAGFTEFDNFKSNQIREGLLTRYEAMRLVEIDNMPKYEALQYFSYVVGFNLDEVLAKIDAIPKMY